MVGALLGVPSSVLQNSRRHGGARLQEEIPLVLGFDSSQEPVTSVGLGRKAAA